MDPVARVFDEWADAGRDRNLENGHRHSVDSILDTLDFGESFSFLDVGCGNGWVVRRMAADGRCARAVGIDKSEKMVQKARKMRTGEQERYHAVSLEEWESDPFDVIFSMETIYYAESVQRAISKAYEMLVPGGRFVCGTDYYRENPDTRHWDDMMDVRLHLHSEAEWVRMFERSGFEVSCVHVTQPGHPEAWKRELGTLFLLGTRPSRSGAAPAG